MGIWSGLDRRLEDGALRPVLAAERLAASDLVFPVGRA
jgi:hypothetical protein